MTYCERKSAIDVHAGSHSGHLQSRFRIPSSVHRASVLVDNRLPLCPVGNLSLELRCGTERKASTNSCWAGTMQNRTSLG